ncbi:hypothetical protein D5R81_15780 [Parashewanella spongiae]|uniref:Cytochrome c domain-containing protein n=1 Tax=Parashewanella spongiae TaxID=342950 RepID=A0A3A6TR03_9GAMM|nr:hypothetical protein [Parashewanella spongiae]MCL1079523.1 hypothetical protein [Parashewanella spongiae]RJY07444.1 hypothetical protein D5R81_15780 [Parashewanella spongiae]
MKINNWVVIIIFTIFPCCLFAASPASNALTQKQEPGGNPLDADLAINNPHEYAWKLFFYLNRQSQTGVAGVPDPAQHGISDYQDDIPTVWESWANETGSIFILPRQANTSEVFLEKGTKPLPWEQLPRDHKQPKFLEPSLSSALPNTPLSNFSPHYVAPEVSTLNDFEVRMNQSLYNQVRDDHLYSVESLQEKLKAIQSGEENNAIVFKDDAKEIKAAWVKITEEQKNQYHWRIINTTDENGSHISELWGLAALHIITKDISNWFYCDFEHKSLIPQEEKDGRPLKDPTTTGITATFGKNGIRDETIGTKWENYRLKGVQTAFLDNTGRPTRLGNTLIEPKDEGISSCMSCHASASIGNNTRFLGRGMPFQASHIRPQHIKGLPNPKDFLDENGKLLYLGMLRLRLYRRIIQTE